MDHKDLPVWQKLLKFVGSDTDEQAEAAGSILKKLTKTLSSEDGEVLTNPNWEPLVENDGIPVLMKVIKSMTSEKAKIYSFRVSQ